jgi:demethylmenaquinone methyltransferase / 2-methoxy-6-polyprenyl-1,4-benzoquinol methylase
MDSNQISLEELKRKKAHAVQGMFSAIASRYDRTNDFISLGLHRLWKANLVKLAGKGESLLDVAAGTGDIACMARKNFRTVYAADPCQEMLEAGIERYKCNNITTYVADAKKLPFEDNSFDAVTISYGVRNFEDMPLCLKEIQRVIKVGGKICILEFGQPTATPIKQIYKAYSKYVVQGVGGIVSRNPQAYRYLDASASVFPCGDDFLSFLHDAGFTKLVARPKCFGIAYLYKGEKAS